MTNDMKNFINIFRIFLVAVVISLFTIMPVAAQDPPPDLRDTVATPTLLPAAALPLAKEYYSFRCLALLTVCASGAQAKMKKNCRC